MNRHWLPAALLSAVVAFPGDSGPFSLPDDVLKAYPAGVREGYQLLVTRCASCHTPARALNSRFLEPGGADDAAQRASLARLKKEQPELFEHPDIWQPEVKIWSRYVKRMMSKPGGDIRGAEGRKIWEFLQYDGVRRKTGANAAKWAAHRGKLLEEFKAENPGRYEELKAAGGL